MLTLSQLAGLVGGSAPPRDENLEITGLAGLSEAQSGEVSFFGHPRYAAELKATQATAVLVPRDFDGVTNAVCIEVDNPSAAFTAVTEKFLPPPEIPQPGIHPSAVVHEEAEVAADACVRENAVIMAGAVIGARSVVSAGSSVGRGASLGEDCLLHSHVVVQDACVLGDRVILHSGVVVGSDGFGYETKNGRHHKIPQSGLVVIENDVEIGANTTIDRARFGRTVIGEGTKIDNLVMIAHNVVIGRHCIICAQVGISGSTTVEDHVVLAGQAGIVGHIKIGQGSIVGAQSGVSNDLAPKSIVVGSPPRPIGEWKRSVIRVDRLASLYSRVKKLEAPPSAD